MGGQWVGKGCYKLVMHGEAGFSRDEASPHHITCKESESKWEVTEGGGIDVLRIGNI